MRGVAQEIIAWSGSSIFKIEERWLSTEIWKEIEEDFNEDYSRYYPKTVFDCFKIKYFPGLMATLLYRFSRYHFRVNNEGAALELSSLARQLTGIELYYSSNIGQGLKINHGAGLVVGARTFIGNNCLLHQNITIGDRKGGRPVIGDNVIIYPGSSVIGAIHVGNNVQIGAHTLVYNDIEDNKIVVGNPNKISDAEN